ncbi:EAL domain-containing protein [Thauera linaloolentis]|uniref:EAL family protein n=1 Tax=Thauera linaloolentis (strain DSM 12138 / JCM 21573 / CCUG 41526 / CIP 105981 / IAM 15112 / NBRC 102519 / 47Lol) TaxID=1123367 RepID=N6YQ43_THAL4|nr:EAL domain-containing protein [Thauera linaloolentis]ENO84507.1 EAL family protein [Thauera linaloolentis 47Lol = DSM 12138]MCM8565251.1 EAL domain-containing protein [Thauera linaloolentis]
MNDRRAPLRARLAPLAELLTINLRVIRDAMVWVVPLLMVSSVAALLAAVLDLLAIAPAWREELAAVNRALGQVLPLCLTVAVSAMLAIRWHLPRPTLVLLNIGYVTLVLGSLDFLSSSAAHALSYIVSIGLPFAGVPLVAHLYGRRWTRLITSDVAGQNVKAALNLIVPGILAGLVLAGGLGLLRGLWPASFQPVPGYVLAGLGKGEAEALYVLLNSCLWSVGIHGYHALAPLLEAMEAQFSAAGSVTSMLGAFVFVGGSGGTLALAIALALAGTSRRSRIVGLAALPPALFNVNELLLFGLPIILNPRLLIPFWLAPLANLGLAQLAIALGLLAPSGAAIPFNSPVILNAWLAAGGAGGIVLQLACVAAGVLIYLPFVRMAERPGRASVIHFPCFDTRFVQYEEEAAILLDDPVGSHLHKDEARRQLTRRLQGLSSQEFILHYQPQLHPASGRITGCEALMRIRNPDGSVTGPAAFLPWLEQAGLMREIDRWVVETACKQALAWREAGIEVPITVNLSAESLSDRKAVGHLVDTIKQVGWGINVEITEGSLARDVETVRGSLEQLRSAGARIYVDDFGTDYSSLCYLHLYPIDAIKIDRSFVLALENGKGQRVFGGLFALAASLELGVVVEGVETPAQLERVPAREDVTVQGWVFSAALGPEAFAGFVSTRHGGSTVAAAAEIVART